MNYFACVWSAVRITQQTHECCRAGGSTGGRADVSGGTLSAGAETPQLTLSQEADYIRISPGPEKIDFR